MATPGGHTKGSYNDRGNVQTGRSRANRIWQVPKGIHAERKTARERALRAPGFFFIQESPQIYVYERSAEM